MSHALLAAADLVIHQRPLPRPVVLDPFCGTGTTGRVAYALHAHFIGLDLGLAYLRDLAAPRLIGA